MATDRICSIPGCGKPRTSGGKCPKHYSAWRRANSPLCAVSGCSRGATARGHCDNHGRRLRLYGDPLAGHTPHHAGLNHLKSLLAGPTQEGCLTEWPFAKNQGYPIADLEGKQMHAARILCILQFGPPPEGYVDAAHRCGVRGCINPAHVYWASRQRNQLDRIDHGTSNRGTRHGNAKLTEAQVLEICARLDRGETQESIAAAYGVSRGNIKTINIGKSWQWLTGRQRVSRISASRAASAGSSIGSSSPIQTSRM